MRVARHVATVVIAGVAALLLAGCVSGDPQPVATSSSSAAPSPSASASAAPVVIPKFLPNGTALANKAYFDYVNKTLLDKKPDAGGQAIIDNLIEAGFDKAAMQVTPDRTAVLALNADSIQFSVQAFEQCLIGQISGHGYTSVIGPIVSDGICLAGKTRPIDWR